MRQIKISFLFLFLNFTVLFIQAQDSPPLMNGFVGTNMQAKGNLAYYSKFGFLREYHSWGADIGLQRTGILVFSQTGSLLYKNEDFTSTESASIDQYLGDGRVTISTSSGDTYKAWAYYNLVGPVSGTSLVDNHDGTLGYFVGNDWQTNVTISLLINDGGSIFHFSNSGQDIKLNIRYEIVTEMRCPQNFYQFNPSYDKSIKLNFDDFYTYTNNNSVEVSPSLMDLAPEMRGISQYLGGCEKIHTQKPICVPNPPEYGYGASCRTGLDIKWADWYYETEKAFPVVGAYSANKTAKISFTSSAIKLFLAIDWNGDGQFSATDEVVEFDVSGTSKFVTMGTDFPIPSGVNSGLYTLRVVVVESGSFPYANGWFNGSMVDVSVNICGNGDYEIQSPLAINTSMEELRAAHITEIIIDNQKVFDNPVVGYTSVQGFLHPQSVKLMELESQTDYKFIVETNEQGSIDWDISLNGISLLSQTSGNKLVGGFTIGNLSSGLNRLSITAGAGNVTHFLFAKEGSSCSNLTLSANEGVSLRRFMINKVEDNSSDYSVIDQQSPSTYKDYALWNTLVAAKYGDGTTPSKYAPFKVLEKGEDIDKKSFSILKYIEVGNEEDAYWWEKEEEENTPLTQIQMLPEQYGAMLSAAYDGGCSTMMHNGAPIGIKNISSSIKVIPAGLTGLRGRYVIDMINSLERTRDCGTILPFDALNFHHYTTSPEDSGDIYYVDVQKRMFDEYNYRPSSGHGVSPESSRLRWMVEKTLHDILEGVSPNAKAELTQKEVWFSEFGYDSQSNVESDSWSAIPDVGDNSPQETQAQWIVRSFLELSAVSEQGMRINKAMVFDLEDRYTGGVGLFDNCGLIKNKINNNAPKKSWFHVQTMRNVLGQTKYQGEFLGKAMTHVAGTGAFDIPFDPDDDILHLGDARIYHYQGDYKGTESDILVIWSPNSSDSEGELTLDLHSQIFLDALLSKNSDFPISNLTIITPQDGDEDGYHKSYSVANNSFTFAGNHVITETPMYVVLNVVEDEVAHNICDLVNPLVTDVSCNSLTVKWAGSYSAFPSGKTKPSVVDLYITEGTGAFDIAEENTDFVIRGYKFINNQYNIGNLKENTKYTVHLVFRWPDGSLEVCDVEGDTNAQLCRLNNGVDFILTFNNGASNNAINAFDYSGTRCGDWGDNDRDGFINGLDSDADGNGQPDAGKTDEIGNVGIVDLWEAPAKIWNSFPLNGEAPSVVVNFKADIDLKSISFLHTTGVGKMKIEFKNCDCPDENWVLYKEVDLVGFYNWYHLGAKPTGRKISKLRFTINYEENSNVGVSMISFCGERGDCWLLNPGPEKPPKKGFMRVAVNNLNSRIQPSLSFTPVLKDVLDPHLGNVKEYDVFYQVVNETKMDFTDATHTEGYFYDGVDMVRVPLNGLEPNTNYKAYLLARRRPYHWPCTSPLNSMRPVVLSPEFQKPSMVVADTIIYFNTYEDGIKDGNGGGNNGTIPKTHIVTASPNPTMGWTTFKWDLLGYNQLFIVSGYTGEVIDKFEVDPTAYSVELDLTNIGNGPYYIRLEGGQKAPIFGQFMKATE